MCCLSAFVINESCFCVCAHFSPLHRRAGKFIQCLFSHFWKALGAYLIKGKMEIPDNDMSLRLLKAYPRVLWPNFFPKRNLKFQAVFYPERRPEEALELFIGIKKYIARLPKTT